MFLAWDAFYDAAQLGLEAQQVIMMRLMKLASGYAAAQGEAVRMIAEKAEVLAAGQIAGALSLARGDSFQTAAAEALGPMRRRLRANHRRLSE